MEDAGVALVPVARLVDRLAELRGDAFSLGMRLFLLVGLATLLLAVFGVFASAVMQSRWRSYEVASLRVVGVSQRSLVRASVLEYVAMLGLAVVLGLASAWLSVRLVLPTISLGPADEFAPAPDHATQWLVLAGVGVALFVLATAIALVVSRRATRLGRPATLRWAEQSLAEFGHFAARRDATGPDCPVGQRQGGGLRMLDCAVATVSEDSAAPSARPVRRDPYRVALLVAAPVIGLYVWWLVADLGGAGVRMLVSDLLFINAPLVAACACWAAHRSRGGRHTGWAWLTAGCLTWAAGAVVWACYELLLGIPSPFPSYADLGYVLYAIPIAIGVTRFPRASGSAWARWRLTLDGVVIAGSLLMVSFIWVLGPVVEATDRTFTRLDALAYPLADVAVASVVLTRCMVVPRTRRLVWLLLSAGLLVLSVTDSVYIARTFSQGGFESGGILDLGWVLSFVLIALAALAPTHEPLRSPVSEQGDPPTLVQQLLPYVAIGAAAASVFGDPSMLERPSQWAWLGVPLVAAIAVRQFVVAADHATLARDLAEAVERRTEQLRHREQWWRDLVQNLSDVVVVIDTEGGIRYCSPSAGSALGDWPQLAASAYDLQSHVHPDDLDEVLEVIRPVLAGRKRHGFVECRIERADGSWGWFEVTTVGQLTERALHGTVLTLHDVSERRRLTDQLTHEAHHDALTGLPNRTLLMKRVERRAGSPG